MHLSSSHNKHTPSGASKGEQSIFICFTEEKTISLDLSFFDNIGAKDAMITEITIKLINSSIKLKAFFINGIPFLFNILSILLSGKEYQAF